MGKWDAQFLMKSSSEYSGPQKLVGEDELPKHVKFVFKNPVRCRIIWMTLSLQRQGSSSFNFENINLLSLDDNPFATVTRRASFGGPESETCLHAKRILVVGTLVKKELAQTQGTDQINMKSLLERAPRLNRFKVTNALFNIFLIYPFYIFDFILFCVIMVVRFCFSRFQLRQKGL